MHAQISMFHGQVGPNSSDQFLMADNFAGSLKQHSQKL
jgi:hypothetical protein